MDKNEVINDGEDFAAMLENSTMEIDSFEIGQLIEPEIVSISNDCIFLQLSGKSEGILDKDELTDKEGNLSVKVGDKVKVFFLSRKNGEMHFTTKISNNEAGVAVLKNAFENGIPVEGVVEKEIKGGFEIKIGESRAFCPFSQMGMKRIENAKEYIGKHITFKIMEHGENGRNILVSNRLILEEEHNKKVEELKKELKENMLIKGTVKSLQSFGAFVDIRGIQALLPISEISRSRVNNVGDYLELGQEIEASIIKLDWRNEKISISMKALLADPWDSVKTNYKIDSKHNGKVVRITNFGAFINLEPGLDGLIHISDLEGDSQYGEPKSKLKVGQEISVKINRIDLDKKRLSLKTATENDESYKQYLDDSSDSDTYNPFAELLKKKDKKKK